MSKKQEQFKVGDRVQTKQGVYVGNKRLYNVSGTIRQCLGRYDLGVEWNIDIGGHNLDSMEGKINNNRGWYVNPEDVIKLDKQLELAFD